MKNLIFTLFISTSITLFAQSNIDRFNVGTNPLHVNPAFTGTLSSATFNANLYRVLSHVNFSTLSFQTYLPKLNSGIGAMVRNFQYGEARETAFGLTYSYQTKLSERFSLSAGISSLFHNRNFNSFIPDLETDFFSFNSGLLLYSDKLFISASVNDIYSFNTRADFSTVIGKKFTIQQLNITPSVGYSFTGYYNTFMARLNLDYKNYIAMTGFKANQYMFGIGYSNHYFGLNYMIENTVSQLSNVHMLNHRFSAQVKIPNTFQRKTKAFGFNLF